jgi:hypothetical protein
LSVPAEKPPGARLAHSSVETKEATMTTPRVYYPISTMTLAPAAGWRPRAGRKATEGSSDRMRLFARRPRGERLSRRESAGLLAVLAVAAAIIGFALVRAEGAPAALTTPAAAIVTGLPNS